MIAWAFVLGGVVMLVGRAAAAGADGAPTSSRRRSARALAIGSVQTLALVPGVSRSGATIIGAAAARASTARRRRSSRFFWPMPTMAAAFAHDFSRSGTSSTPERRLEIAVGFVTAFVAAVMVVRPFLAFVGRVGLRAVCVVSHRRRACAIVAAARGGRAVMQWLRRSFIAGFFVTVPLFISVAALDVAVRGRRRVDRAGVQRLLGPADARAWAS